MARLEAELKRARDFAAGAQRRFLATAKQRCVIEEKSMCVYVYSRLGACCTPILVGAG